MVNEPEGKAKLVGVRAQSRTTPQTMQHKNALQQADTNDETET